MHCVCMLSVKRLRKSGKAVPKSVRIFLDLSVVYAKCSVLVFTHFDWSVPLPLMLGSYYHIYSCVQVQARKFKILWLVCQKMHEKGLSVTYIFQIFN